MISRKQTIAAAGLALVLGAAGVAGSVVAQAPKPAGQSGTRQGMDQGAMVHGEHAGAESDAAAADGRPALPGSPATEAYRAANLAMHAAMDMEFSEDADIDFARSMIGHHQGAIDMARIMLMHGTDPELRQLAEEVIEAQEGEIAFLRDWLAKHGQ